MMKQHHLLYTISLFFMGILIACESDFTSNYANDLPILVVEGWVTDTGEPQRIIISESLTQPMLDGSGKGVILGNLINSALVILRSDTQAADTLIKEFYDTDWSGYYISNNIKGIPEETFYLRVEYEGEIYEAQAYMPKVPSIDSISFGRKRVSKENALLFVPLVNFQDPIEEENYYLFKKAYIWITESGEEDWHVMRGGDPWMISLFTDEYINGSNAQLNVHDGITVNDYWLDGNFWLITGERVGIQMHSLTKEGYEFYRSLINQLNYAAGVFHPTPASPPGNISNGGLGFFGATAVSRCSAIVPNGDKYEN
jgi:hypothetical protein